MWTRATLTTLLFAFAAAPALNAQAPARPPSMLLPGTTEKISAHVYAIPDKDTSPSIPGVGIIVGIKGALVVDTGLGEANGRIVLAEAQKVAPGRQLYLVSTHVHPEHDLGANAFPASTKMIRSADQEKDIDEFGLQLANFFASRSAVEADLLKGATFRKADIEFDKQYDLDLGGVNVHILALGPNHTRGDTGIFVKEDRVLFAGDVAMAGQPNFSNPPSSSLDHWLATLDVLAAFKPAIVVPAHGPIGDASYIANYRTYLTTIRDRTRVLKQQGRTVDESIQIITEEMKSRYPNANRISGAVKVAYQEAP
jgi:glyoxylase-like metal-dependent hydrolase (beta-lactamase superfamily II)